VGTNRSARTVLPLLAVPDKGFLAAVQRPGACVTPGRSAGVAYAGLACTALWASLSGQGGSCSAESGRANVMMSVVS
jgi:hypothetical protein